jgi:hypothetical protein
MGVAMAIGLFDYLDSVAMVPTHVWDAVPSDVVTSVILAAAAAVCAGLNINEYKDSPIGDNTDPMIVHAGLLLPWLLRWHTAHLADSGSGFSLQVHYIVLGLAAQPPSGLCTA